MKDFLGNELGIGDGVVFMQKEYRNFLKCIVIKMTPKMIVISHERTNVGDRETKQFPSQVIKIIG